MAFIGCTSILYIHCLQAPSQVTGVFLSKAVRQGRAILRVTWTTPQSNVTISQYLVQYRRNGTTFWSIQVYISGSPPATSAILTRLDAGTEYNVRVRAVSAAGAGEWSVEQTERTFESELLCIIYCYNVHGKCSIISVIILVLSPCQPALLYTYTSASAWLMYTLCIHGYIIIKESVILLSL